MIELKLNPREFKVVGAWLQFYDCIVATVSVEVTPGYYCDIDIVEDDIEHCVCMSPVICSDNRGYIYTDSRMDGTAAVASDRDIERVAEFAVDYYADHPEEFVIAE